MKHSSKSHVSDKQKICIYSNYFRSMVENQAGQHLPYFLLCIVPCDRKSALYNENLCGDWS